MSNAESILQLLLVKSKFPSTLPIECRVADVDDLKRMLDDLWPLKTRTEQKFDYSPPPADTLFGFPVITDPNLPRGGFLLIDRDGKSHWYSSEGWL